MKNGWLEKNWNDALDGGRLINYVNDKWFGFMVSEYQSGEILSFGLIINNKRYGWRECYDEDGTIDPNWCGLYLNNMKI